MDELAQLEELGLVSKIASEIENHMSISDTTLARFVISIHEQSKGLSDFESKLNEVGAEFPQSLIESIDRLILTLQPSRKTAAGPVHDDDEQKSRKARVFKGLAIPDRTNQEPTELDTDNPLDDTFAMLENLGGKADAKPKERGARRRSRSPLEEDERSYGRNKRYRPRSRSPRRKRNNDELVFEDEYGRTKASRMRDTKRNRQKYRDDDIDEFRRQPTPELDDSPQLFKVYDGTVQSIKDFGAFVRITGLKKPMDGLVHVSQLSSGRVNHPSDLVSRHQPVKAKVIKLEGQRVSLSMRDVDQRTGQDLAPSARIGSGANSQALGSSEIVPTVKDTFNTRRNGMRKRMTSPERWEIKQLIASGVIPRSDYPDIDRDNVDEEGRFEEEEEVEIELVEKEPAFLAGQTQRSLELSPIRIVKNPEGSLARAATQGAVLAQERRELRQQEAQEQGAKEAEKVDLSSQWNDPMAQKRQLASQIRSGTKEQPTGTLPEWRKIANKTASLGKHTTLSMKEQRENLPIFKFREQFLQAIRDNQVLVFVGETGSGKTTQLCQYLQEGGLNPPGMMIGITQPRRVAAIKVAERVAEEVGCVLGEEVGYTIRFSDCTSNNTHIKFMTDGILLNELSTDDMLSKYSVIVIDEAHERSIPSDTALGLLQKTLAKRPDLKLIVTSATMNADRFSEYFSCPTFQVPGRSYPVEILYSREPVDDYVDEALTTIMTIHLTEPGNLDDNGGHVGGGDILLFLTGSEEIESACVSLEERIKALGPAVPELIILPIYSALPQDIASRVFEPTPPGSRKCIMATNIAETSLTIENISYIVDPGFCKQNSWHPTLGMDRLEVVPISQAQANQRSGRAGRTRAGKAYRLYTEAAYNNEMLPSPIPDIQRANLSSTILMLKAMGINDLLGFKFLDPPPTATLLQALEELYHLEFLDEEGLLNRAGMAASRIPVNPALAKTLLKSAELQCGEEVVMIASILSVEQSIWYSPKDKQQEASRRRARFSSGDGDHIAYLNVWNAWKDSGYSVHWCTENFIKPKGLASAQNIRKQLLDIMKRQRLQVTSCGGDSVAIRKAFTSGFFRNTARKDQEGYKTFVEGTPVHIHPSSALFGKQAETVLYHSLTETSREWMNHVSIIEPKWLPELAPNVFSVAKGLSKRQKAERIQPLHNKFAGEDDWRLSAQKRAGRGGGGTWG